MQTKSAETSEEIDFLRLDRRFLIFCEGQLRHTIPLDPPGKHLIGSKFVSNFRDGWKDRIAGSNGEGTM